MGYKKCFGAIPSEYDIRDYRLKKIAYAANYPESFSLFENIEKEPDVLNQGSVGACPAFAMAAVFQYFNIVQNKVDEKFSTDANYGNRENSAHTGPGMVVRDMLLNAIEFGDCYLKDLPGNHEVPDAIKIFEANKDMIIEKGRPHRITKVFRASSINEIKHTLMNYGPLLFTITWYADMKYKDGILDSMTLKDATGAHCMFIYGWDKDGWLIQNSWGKAWGKKGRAILPFDFPLIEVWGVVDDIHEGAGDEEIIEPFNSKVGKIIAKVINTIFRFFAKILRKIKE